MSNRIALWRDAPDSDAAAELASLLDWGAVMGSLLLGLTLIAVRTATKVGCSVAAARLSGSTERKGLLTGLALMPMSAFAILLIEQSRVYGFAPAAEALSLMAGRATALSGARVRLMRPPHWSRRCSR
jgi:Kef-type K+ transport system membrane component KefB